MQLLREHRVRQQEAILAAGGALRDLGWGCTSPTGGLLSPQWLTDEWRKACKAERVDVRLHDLRHLHASTLIAKGVPINVVSKRLGHSNITTTLSIYAHLMPMTDEEAADEFEEAMAEAR